MLVGTKGKGVNRVYRKIKIEEFYFSSDVAIQSKRMRKARHLRHMADVFFRVATRKEIAIEF
jgi:hypothetical protein